MEKALKQIPIGIDNFKKLIERDTYFVDKSLFIKDVIENNSEIILFTRPRRFGKTLNFSMLKCFLETPGCRRLDDQDEDYLHLFKGFKIDEDKELIAEHSGKYPVIEFSFKKVKANNWERASYLFKEEISREYYRHSYLLEEDVVKPAGNRNKFERIMNMEGEIIEYTSAIVDLSNYLSKYYSKRAIVLIDEYDTPLHYAKLNGYYEEMLDIIRALMVDGMKGNDYLEKGIITGIMKISQESIFSAFNNPEIATLTSRFCADKFGFTEEEVFQILNYYGLSNYQEIVQQWYNGYLFGGNTVIYNPWSILNFIKNEDHLPRTYWVNTGDTTLIKRCLQLDQTRSKEYVQELLNNKVLEKEVEQNIVYEDVFNDVDQALSYLLHAGYLKARVKDRENYYELSIPNKEVAQIYKSILKNWFNRDQKTDLLIHDMVEDLLAAEQKRFEDDLASILLTVSSYYDTAVSGQIKKTRKKMDTERYENFYHGLMLGIMVNIGNDYYVESNKEYGLGRPDLVIMPKDKSKRAYILEFKNVPKSSHRTVEEAAQKALQQIEDYKYIEGIKKTGVNEILQVGLGFKGKEVKVLFQIK